MIRSNKTVRMLGIAVAVMMAPLFMGLVCPCAEAAAENSPVIQSAPCDGCCPEMMASQGVCDAGLETPDAVKTPEFNSTIFSFQPAVHSFSPETASNVQFAGPPANWLSFSHEPLFVLNQVFRL